MAQLTAGSEFRLDELDLAALIDGTVTSSSSTQFNIDASGGSVVTFTGSGFTFDGAGRPAGGTIAGIRETRSDTIITDITGLATPMSQFLAWADTGDNGTALATIFGGNDNMSGSAFADVLEGHAGHDNLFGGSGADRLDGGDGNDHLYGQSANGGTDEGDVILAGDGADYLQGNAGRDTLDGANGSDRIQGGADNDLAFGGDGNDSANGNKGSDTILGNGGNDALRGGADNDSVSGGDGNDVLQGDAGADTLSGGAGIDLFQIDGTASLAGAPDSITDFSDGTDHIAIRQNNAAILPSAVLTGSAQSSAEAQSLAVQLMQQRPGDGEFAAIAVGGDTYVFYSVNPAAPAEHGFRLEGIGPAAIGFDDFV